MEQEVSQIYLEKLAKKTQKIVRYNHKTPHNNYLYVWIELGILGLIILLSIFYFQIRELIKLKDGFIRILLPIMYLAIMFTIVTCLHTTH